MINLPSVSIIIPVLNEQSRIADALTAFRSHARESQARGQEVDQRLEVIVVDGGSSDRTAEIVRSFDFVRFTVAEQANRGWQMNQGARMANGEILVFLHADVKFPRRPIDAIRQALDDEHMVGGCFQICFPVDAPMSLKLVAWGINLRTRLFRTATGDQAIFVRRRVFEEIGGYQMSPLMEDIEFFQKVKQRGRISVLDEKVEISPRRWLKQGIWRTVLLMYLLRGGYWLGIHPATLKRFFPDVR
ncbi:MAG: TIGR04283 family arsenosugar biosynthesis glycosyltransferase [Acidobacteriota bacterium]|nr:TIGR04283 family arsenosugar biosynthesis glycosyltransferase [Acidobacteriota bacterium]